MDGEDVDVKAFLCFGRAEQVRNLCSLVYFRSMKDCIISIPWGPSCASFITYPAGLTNIYDKKDIVVGPTDPTGNYWFPENFLSIGIPFDIASRMALDLDSSFIIKRPKVAFPTNHVSIPPENQKK